MPTRTWKHSEGTKLLTDGVLRIVPVWANFLLVILARGCRAKNLDLYTLGLSMRYLTYYVYIMAGRSRTLYTGVTNNLERRVLQHRDPRATGFTARYKVNWLVYYERFGDVRAAISREKQIKGWGRMKKVGLI